VAARIKELKEEREFAAQAAIMPAPAVLEMLKNSGIERLIDFFERDAAGNFHVADFKKVSVEVAIAFLRFIRRAFAIRASQRPAHRALHGASPTRFKDFWRE
jgi:hypothetical protein